MALSCAKEVEALPVISGHAVDLSAKSTHSAVTCAAVMDGRVGRNTMPRTYWQVAAAVLAIGLDAPQVKNL